MCSAEPSDFSNSDSVLVPGFLRGYRQWETQLTSGKPGLRALNWASDWHPGRNVAQCHNPIHHDPLRCAGFSLQQIHEMGVDLIPPDQVVKPDCVCGFYALHEYDEWQAFGTALSPGGVIKAYGRTVIGTKGFRAQYAEIEALMMVSAHVGPEAYRAIRDQYDGIPVYDSWEEIAKDFPPIKSDLIPGPPTKKALTVHTWPGPTPPIIGFSIAKAQAMQRWIMLGSMQASEE